MPPCRAKAELEAATATVAGIEAGDGRDSSGHSLDERLQEAKIQLVSEPTHVLGSATGIWALQHQMTAPPALAALRQASHFPVGPSAQAGSCGRLLTPVAQVALEEYLDHCFPRLNR